MTRAKASRFADVPAFAGATPELQGAILDLIGDAETVHLYPSRNAFVEGWGREEQDVSARDAAHLLAHIPPPFYTTPEAAMVAGLLVEPDRA